MTVRQMSEPCDVLVVGAGGAALRAAIAAYERDPALDVVVVTKGELGKSGVTATACSDRMAFHATLDTTEPGGDDAWRYHADDIYRIGGYVSDADLAEVLGRYAGEAFAYLDGLDVPWARQADGVVDQFVTDGSEYARACYTGPHTANHIEEALVRRLAELPIRVIEGAMVAELLLNDQGRRVVGAALLDQESGRVAALGAKAVVLATGGGGQLFAVNVFPPECTGDGYALAYRAGAELVNLEFIQIGLSSIETKLACSGSMMRALPRLINDQGHEFLPDYFPPGTPYAEIYAVLYRKGASWPVSYREPSHIIDIAVHAERSRGRRVFMDYSRNPQGLDLAALAERIPSWQTETKGVALAQGAQADTPLARLLTINRPSVEWLAERGVDLCAGDAIEIAPAIQHFQGGVKIRPAADTTVAGLYAAGETAGGQHGANRPGGNALMDTQVFGRIAGESAAHYAAQSTPGQVAGTAADAVQALLRPDGLPAAEVREAVQRAMAEACGVYRTAQGLQALNATLDDLVARGVRDEVDALAEAVEAVNLLAAARLVARAALARDESRGPHLRFAEGSLTPIPRDDDRWERYVVLKRGDAGPELAIREPMRPEPSARR